MACPRRLRRSAWAALCTVLRYGPWALIALLFLAVCDYAVARNLHSAFISFWAGMPMLFVATAAVVVLRCAGFPFQEVVDVLRDVHQRGLPVAAVAGLPQ
jgi:hypothetical protein